MYLTIDSVIHKLNFQLILSVVTIMYILKIPLFISLLMSDDLKCVDIIFSKCNLNEIDIIT